MSGYLAGPLLVSPTSPTAEHALPTPSPLATARRAPAAALALAVLLASTLAVVLAGPASAAVSPTGNLELVTSPEAGRIRVAGWARDDDAPGVALDLHVYVGGPAGSAAPGYVFPRAAGQTRSDVGPHAFDLTFTTSATGSLPVYVYAIDGGGGDANTSLPNNPGTAVVVDPSPTGSLDLVSGPASSTVRVAGWAIDRSSATAPVTIHAYVGGPAGSPGAVLADLGPAGSPRSDVAAAYPGAGPAHGFDVAFTTARTGRQDVYVYALNLAGTVGGNTFLGSRSIDVPLPVISVVRGPLVVGKRKIGRRLAAGLPAWSVDQVASAYQWLRDGRAISGATRQTYRVRREDRGTVLAVRVTGTRAGWTSATATTTAGKVRATRKKNGPRR